MKHWSEEARLDLWPFAMNYAVWLWNHLPNQETGLSPNDIFNQTLELNFKHLKRTHIWGCPTYVLKLSTKDGCKQPKWQPKAQRGIFLGFSESHSTQIGLIKNIKASAVFPKYHMVYDDHFTTVTNSEESGIPYKQQLKDWETLVQTNSEKYWDINDPDHVPPPLSSNWNNIPVLVTDASNKPLQSACLPVKPKSILYPPVPAQPP